MLKRTDLQVYIFFQTKFRNFVILYVFLPLTGASYQCSKIVRFSAAPCIIIIFLYYYYKGIDYLMAEIAGGSLHKLIVNML